MPAGEAAMLLLESLTGIAELETEHLALEKVNCETGIQTILDALRAPLSERSLRSGRQSEGSREKVFATL